MIAAAGVVTLPPSRALAAEPAKDTKDAKPAAQPEMKLPPGWTMADVQACMLAGTPGKMHEHLAKSVGVWEGKGQMWMAPGAEPVETQATSTVTSLMNGRYFKCEVTGEMPGEGPYVNSGTYGFDNVSQKFVATWIGSTSTGIMNGFGELSADGKTMTWSYTFNCPLTKKPAALREVETTTGPSTKTLDVFSTDPKSGKEFKMMSLELTRKP